MSSAPVSPDPQPADGESVALPEQVRQRIISFTASALPALNQDEIPISLRRFVRFTPSRRARLAAVPIASALATDSAFRQHVADKVVDATGELGSAVTAGVAPAAADPVDVAAIAYLAQPTGWPRLVEAAVDSVSAPPGEPEDDQLARLNAQLAKAQQTYRADMDKLRNELVAVREENSQLTAQLRQVTTHVRQAQREASKAAGDLAAERGRREADAKVHEGQLRRLRGELAASKATLEVARQAAKTERGVEESRLSVLLTVIEQASQGLRTELGLDAVRSRPADVAFGEQPAERVNHLDAALDDVARLDQLLAWPQIHLIVDGYNVTKSGFGELSLEQQRFRLVNGLAALGAQTSAEITVVFDGTDRLSGMPAPPRGVRVVFSQGGRSADEVIQRLVRTEPVGRPLVVISSDREVAEGVARAGAYALPATALLTRLSRA